MITVAVLGPSDLSNNALILKKDESYFIQLANIIGELLAKIEVPIITVPYKGIGYFAALSYKKNQGTKLIGVLPSGVESAVKLDEVIGVDNWVRQPEALVSRANIMVVVGLSAGTMMEVCLTKRYKKYPIIIFQEHITRMPEEIEKELNISYVRSIDELESKLKGLTKA